MDDDTWIARILVNLTISTFVVVGVLVPIIFNLDGFSYVSKEMQALIGVIPFLVAVGSFLGSFLFIMYRR